MHAERQGENYQEAEPLIAYSGLCTSELAPGLFPIIMNVKNPILLCFNPPTSPPPPPSFLLLVSKGSNKPYMGA